MTETNFVSSVGPFSRIEMTAVVSVEKSHSIDGKRCDVKKALSKEDVRKAEQSERERQERDSRGGRRGRE